MADTTQYRDLQINVESYINEEYLKLHTKSVEERLQNATSEEQKQQLKKQLRAKPIKVNVYPGVLEQCKNNVVYQSPVAWIYAGKSKARIVMDILYALNDSIYENEILH